MLALTTAEITHGGPRRTTTRTSPWYVLSARVRVRSGQGWGRRAKRCTIGRVTCTGSARACSPRVSRAGSRPPRATGARHPPKLSAALRVQATIASIRELEDVAQWNKNVLSLEGNGKHRLQIGDILDRGSKKHPELGVIIRVAKVTDDNTLAFAPALLWAGKDAVDETAEFASKLAKWRKQYKHWHKDSARPLQLGFDTILKAISDATPWYAPASASPLPACHRCCAVQQDTLVDNNGDQGPSWSSPLSNDGGHGSVPHARLSSGSAPLSADRCELYCVLTPLPGCAAVATRMRTWSRRKRSPPYPCIWFR